MGDILVYFGICLPSVHDHFDDYDTLIKCGSFQQDFRNSNGKPRREKVLIDLEQLDEDTVHFVDF